MSRQANTTRARKSSGPMIDLDPLQSEILSAVASAHVVYPTRLPTRSRNPGISWEVEIPSGKVRIDMNAAGHRPEDLLCPEFSVIIGGHALGRGRAQDIGNAFNEARILLFCERAKQITAALDALDLEEVRISPAEIRSSSQFEIATVFSIKTAVSGVELATRGGRGWTYELTIGGEAWLIRDEGQIDPSTVYVERHGIRQPLYLRPKEAAALRLSRSKDFVQEAVRRLDALTEIPRVDQNTGAGIRE